MPENWRKYSCSQGLLAASLCKPLIRSRNCPIASLPSKVFNGSATKSCKNCRTRSAPCNLSSATPTLFRFAPTCRQQESVSWPCFELTSSCSVPHTYYQGQLNGTKTFKQTYRYFPYLPRHFQKGCKTKTKMLRNIGQGQWLPLLQLQDL